MRPGAMRRAVASGQSVQENATKDPDMNFLEALDAEMEDIASACTTCGKCFQACPMTEAVGIDKADPQNVLTGMVDLLRGGDGTDEARRWAASCSSSGLCAQACDYGVDPRMLVRLANY